MGMGTQIKNVTISGLRWVGSEEHSVFLQRAGVWFPHGSLQLSKTPVLAELVVLASLIPGHWV